MKKRNKTKKKALFISVLAICFMVLALTSMWKRYYDKNYSGVPDAVSSSYFGSECRLTVAANASGIENREAFASEVFAMCRENSFQTIKLSTDVTGWPSCLYITVYLHRSDIGKKDPEMYIWAVPPDNDTEYNIKDNGSEYQLIVK